ncbi:TolC family protein [Marinomonas algarum]|uniref:TolC family protein n=1 Tax=Marinomonas algarum TaxID=2883105 RepID=A0A9X1LFN1_9GAMM|nr:TolC family protein [Marinomonas algarum]MCB5163093.1 TolC family protein [Marinomonas algarum]
MKKSSVIYIPAFLASCSFVSLSVAAESAVEPQERIKGGVFTLSDDSDKAAPSLSKALDDVLANSDADAAQPADPHERVLSVNSIVQQVLKQNSQVIYADIQRQVSAEKVNYESGVYQSEFFSNLNYSDAHTQRTAQEKLSSTTAGNLNVLDETNTSFSAGVRKLFTTGGEATISFDTVEKDNNIIPYSYTYADRPERDSEFTSAVRLQLTQPLLKGLNNVEIESRIRRAELEVNIVEAQYQQQLLKIVSQSLSLYWQLYKATRFLEIRNLAVENAEKMVVDIEKRIKSGKEPESALVDAKSELLKRKVALASARQVQNEVSYQISTLVNDDSDNLSMARYVLKSGPNQAPFELSGSFEEYYQRVYAIWPNAKILQQNIAIQDEEIRVAQDSGLPTLDLELGYSTSNLARESNTGDAFDSEYPTWNVGLSFSMPIGHNQRANAQKSMAMLKQEQHKQDLRAVEVSLKNDLRARLYQVNTTYQEMNTLKENINILEDLYLSEVRKFNLGYGNIKDIYLREDTLNLERQRHIDGVIKYELAKVSLSLADGSLLNM